MDSTQQLIDRAKSARGPMNSALTDPKNQALHSMSRLLDERRKDLVEANDKDMRKAEDAGLDHEMVTRLKFDDAKIDSRRESIEIIADLPDPVGDSVEAWRTADGLNAAKVRVPIGVILMIYESRPHVTVNAGAFGLKSGNVMILRGGSEVAQTNAMLSELWQQALKEANLPAEAVQVVQISHEEVGDLIQRPEDVNLVIPRGSVKMVKSIAQQSRVPLLKHEEGICHVFIDHTADVKKATDIAVDSKTLLPSVCNAMETLLVHKDLQDSLGDIVGALQKAGVKIIGDETVQKAANDVQPATDEDWNTEYLDMILSIRVVDDVDQAINHVNTYGNHTDSIVTDTYTHAQRFCNEVDSAVLLVNASTMFDDGKSMGMGAEVGISTGRIHARGLIGLRDLTIPKYVIQGDYHYMGEGAP